MTADPRRATVQAVPEQAARPLRTTSRARRLKRLLAQIAAAAGAAHRAGVPF
jgi:hypothetical protein